jgi:hypothetical protein
LNNFTIIAREFDKGRGARTTSIKTLPTLVPLVMCFNCEMITRTNQIKKKETEQNIRCIHIWGKILLIVQIKEDSYFKDIKKLKELSSLSKGYRFVEGDKSLNENQMLKKGTHFIHYRCLIKGGGKEVWIKDLM